MRDQTEVDDLGISGNLDRRVSRRAFLGLGGMSAAALMLNAKGVLSQTSRSAGYGALVPDPGGLIDLPRGFQYRIISEEGSPLSSGVSYLATTMAWQLSRVRAVAQPFWCATTSRGWEIPTR